MALFVNPHSGADLPRIPLARGEDLRRDAARAIGQVLAIKSAGSADAATELQAFFNGCLAALAGRAVDTVAVVTGGQTFPLGAQTLTARVSGGVLTFTVA